MANRAAISELPTMKWGVEVVTKSLCTYEHIKYLETSSNMAIEDVRMGSHLAACTENEDFLGLSFPGVDF